MGGTFKDHQFKPGVCGNPAGHGPGRGYGGRTKALMLLDQMLEEAGNIDLLRASFQVRFEKNPAKFFQELVMPLLPKETIGRLTGEGQRVVEWRSLLSVCAEVTGNPVIDVSE